MTLRELITQLETIISEGTSETTEVDRILPPVRFPGTIVAMPSGEDAVTIRLLGRGGNQEMMMARMKEKIKPIKVKE